MDQNQNPPTDQDTIAEVKATQVAGHEAESMPEIENEEQLHEQLDDFNRYEWLGWIKHRLLRILPIVLVFHGAINIYSEIVEVFYVFPHIAEIVEDTGYEEDAVNTVYLTAILIMSTAAIETIYGMALLARHHGSMSGLHIFSATGVFVVSLLINQQSARLEDFDTNHRLPQTPTIQNIIQVRSVNELVELYRRT